MVVMDDGESRELAAGDLFAVAPGHDSWVMETSLRLDHLMGGRTTPRPRARPVAAGRRGRRAGQTG